MQIVMRNMMEDVVAKKVEKMCESYEGCTCERCRMDMVCYALNRIPPHYVVTSEGALFGKIKVIQTQFDADVTTAVGDAMRVVQGHPRHTEDEIV